MMNTKPVSRKLMNISAFDLNLLSVFCVVYDSGSISRAADLLDISPSAVSQSLSKLKTRIGDNLFNRQGKQFHPTAFADELYAQVSDHLGKIADTLQETGSTPTRKTLTISTSFSLSSMVIPPLYQCLLQENAGFSLHHTEAALTEPVIRELLNYRRVDIVFSPTQVKYNGLTSEKLFSTPLVLVCSKKNPIYGQTISEEEYIAADAVGYTAVSDKIMYFRQQLEKKYPTRNKRLLTTSMSVFLSVVSNTQSIGLLPRRMLSLYARHAELRELAPPFELPEISICASFRQELAEEEDVIRLLACLKTHLSSSDD
ncbi:LysR family transcriptional regulator [Citrobacter portucalensis]|uniref:LysR family transcriptional regulator n=1 Tax=Citrobacter portucalensis TaxID=1639133 RepID=UPI0018E72B33|nr:LysR family transcriptional regulator [Citrobacter portucalensis]UMB86612.1 LysR family transcriptional regulator [Citrobacter portucalensis]